MSFWEFWKNRDIFSKILRIVRLAILGAKTIDQARNQLATRLAHGARAGDFDDAIKSLTDSDTLAKDFIANG
jgi:hypothetical protein